MNLSVITKLCTIFGVWSFRDIIEIIFISTIFYYLSRWLATHVTKKLVFIMYGYCLIIIGSYALTLPFTFNFLVAAAPLVAMLLILMHQETLQKNFIVPQRIIPASRDQSWIEALIQSCMISSSQNKDLTIVIQRYDDISSYIKVGCIIDTLAHKELLLALINSSSYVEESFIYVLSNGTLAGINSTFQRVTDKLSPDIIDTIDASRQSDAISLSAKTDALIIKCNHVTSTFSIILRGSMTPAMTAHAVTQLIVDYVHDPSISKKGLSHDNKSAYTQSSGSHRA